MPPTLPRSIACSVALLLTLAGPALAQWSSDPTVNLPICTDPHNQVGVAIASDGAGGAIFVWQDSRSGNNDIYAQRVDATGVPKWTTNGIAVCATAGDQLGPSIVADGAGGAIVAWQDSRNGAYDIYAQRVSATGSTQWTAGGVAVCLAAAAQESPTLASDGTGGAIITWQDNRSGNFDVYAQRVSAAGVAQWTTDGVALCTAPDYQAFPVIIPDGTGGAIVTWEDHRGGVTSDIYAQRVSAAGTPLWATNGVALCAAPDTQDSPTIVPDAAGGAIVTWEDFRSGTDYDVYAQRVDSTGTTRWTPDGVALSVAGNDQATPTIVADGAGGAIVTWQDFRNNADWNIYAQRVDSAGVARWTADGVALCLAASDQLAPTLVSDGGGGAIVTWYDYRSGNADIYARRVSAMGTPQWAADGVALCTNTSAQTIPLAVPDGSGGAIVTWGDQRNGTFNNDVYAQNVRGNGSLGGSTTAVPPPSRAGFALLSGGPNPSAGPIRVAFTLPDAAPATLVLWDLAGRRLRTLSVGELGPGLHQVTIAQLDRALAPGIYLVELAQGAQRASRKVTIVR